MEVLLFALFFISALIFFIAGKDDFGRTENKLIIKEEEEDIKAEVKVTEEVKKEDIKAEVKVTEEVKKEDIKAEVKVTEEVKKEDNVTEDGNIKPQEELKKES